METVITFEKLAGEKVATQESFTADELLALKPEFIQGDNEWKYIKRTNVLRLRRGGYVLYEVDLDWCRTSAEVLDWIFQILRKPWCSAKTIRDLLLQLQERIKPQANLCSFGIERGRQETTCKT